MAMDMKKILIAIDGSENSMRAVSYVGSIVGNCPGFRIKLLYIERLPSRDFFADEETWLEECKKQKETMQEFLHKSQDLLISKGILEENISREYIESCQSPTASRFKCSQGTSIAQDILDTQKREGWETVVIGRRGVSKTDEFLFGSVSNKIVHAARSCTVWVVQ
jgi:nucleotide-binding universal stress UspA family protein